MAQAEEPCNTVKLEAEGKSITVSLEGARELLGKLIALDLEGTKLPPGTRSTGPDTVEGG
jgi:hypothetical protein